MWRRNSSGVQRARWRGNAVGLTSIIDDSFFSSLLSHGSHIKVFLKLLIEELNSNSNLLKQQRAKSHLQVAKTMIKHATYAYYI